MRENSRFRTRFALWTRLLVAGVILTATLLVAIGGELLIVGLISVITYAAVVGATAAALSPIPALGALGPAVGLGCYLGLLFVGVHAFRIAHSDELDSGFTVIVAEMRATVASLRRRLGIAGLLVTGLGVGVALLLAHRFAGSEGVETAGLIVPAVVTLSVVGTQFVRTVRSELSGDVAVLRTLDETVALSDDVDRDPELEDLRRRVERLAQQADVPAPTVEIAVTRTPTAMTVGYRPATSTIVLSRGLVADLDDRELEAVLAHELAHVANRDAAVMSAMTVPASKAEEFFERYDGGVLGLLVLALQGLSRWSVIVVARYREYVADDGAVAITGDPAGLASALETLDRSVGRRPATDLRQHRTAAAFSIVPPPREEHRFFDRTRRFVERRLFGTHPPTERRIERLRSTTSDSPAAAGQ
ncbi:M48 family metallopeptidase [Haloterrigena salinisoli]|uniref:M48 family metallopeptidase n=1 Tax=Haloterrigena salinisoli TaxID=3132747 RepID=UPI0030CDF1CC